MILNKYAIAQSKSLKKFKFYPTESCRLHHIARACSILHSDLHSISPFIKWLTSESSFDQPSSYSSDTNILDNLNCYFNYCLGHSPVLNAVCRKSPWRHIAPIPYLPVAPLDPVLLVCLLVFDAFLLFRMTGMTADLGTDGQASSTSLRLVLLTRKSGSSGHFTESSVTI